MKHRLIFVDYSCSFDRSAKSLDQEQLVFRLFAVYVCCCASIETFRGATGPLPAGPTPLAPTPLPGPDLDLIFDPILT